MGARAEDAVLGEQVFEQFPLLEQRPCVSRRRCNQRQPSGLVTLLMIWGSAARSTGTDEERAGWAA
jgi:hypothetical protein